MCAVKETCLFRKSGSACSIAGESLFRSVDSVASNPRNFKLSPTTGSITSARRNSVCAGRSSALNRRRLSSISGQNLQQPVFDKMAQQFVQVLAKHFWLDVEFREEFLVRRVNVGRSRHHLPDARAGFIQAE